MDKLFSLYSLFKTDKRKERFDIILEPLQALTQLSLMAFCPNGSKLTIANNLLFIQTPNWGQGLMRSFNNDNRDDLFFLFNAIIRFNKFYIYLKGGDNSNRNDKLLYDLLVKLGKRGIDNILQTYANVDQPALLHTLQMYRTLLDNPGLINASENVPATNSSSSSSSSSNDNKNNKNNDKNSNNNNNSNNNDNANANVVVVEQNSKKNIDDIFIKIRDIYTIHDRNLIFHILTLIEKRPDYYEHYIMALNNVMEPINVQIKKWINDNIVY